MSQVFINLLLNSCEVLEKNGIINVTSRSDKGILEILFEDNGPGVSETDQSKIFDPFYTTHDEGTGLGLAISCRIVESYGGSIRLEKPKKGNGALFIVSLPQKDQGA